MLSASMEKKRKEIIDAAKGEEYPPGTVDVRFLDNITMLLNKPTPDWPEQ